MEYFKKDEKMILFGFSISEGSVDVYSYCSECKVFNDAIVYIEKGIVSRIELEDKEDLTK